MRHILLAALLSLSVGCVGGITGGDDDGDDGDDAPPVSILGKQMFDRDVYPILSVKCSAGCHLVGNSTSTAFVTPTVADAHFTATSYSSVVGNFTETGAPILTKITTTSHNSRTYTIQEQDLIKAWLAQEVIDRQQPVDPNDPPPTESPGQVTARLISQWSGCLDVQDFIELQFGEVWANKGSNEGNCENCHIACAHGFCAMDDNTRMYEIVSGTATASSFYMMMFFRANVVDLQNAMMEPNLEPFYKVGGNEAPFTEHPSFNPDAPTGGVGVSPIAQTQELYNRTMARLTAGTCGPPILPP